MEFLLGEDTVVVDIHDDDTSKHTEGMKEGATELPREPKEEPMDTTTESVLVWTRKPVMMVLPALYF